MDCKKALKSGMVVVTLLVAGILTTTPQQQIQASSDREANQNDFAGTAGWKEGKNDYLNGNAFEYECSSDNTDTYCDLYRTGYERGWQAQIDLGREHGSDPQ